MSGLLIGAAGLGFPVVGSIPHLFVALTIMSVYTGLTFWQVLDDFDIDDE